jgi:hypothetical protein
MKTIKSSLLGMRMISEGNADITLNQLKDVIKEQRAAIITRIMNDIPAYLDYHFQTRLHKDLLFTVKEQLLKLRHDEVNLSGYDTLVNQVLNRPVIYLSTEPFYAEINECLAPYAADKQLKFSA